VTSEEFNIEEVIKDRLRSDDTSDIHLEALATLVDAELTNAERAIAFAHVLKEMIERLTLPELDQFRRLAQRDGEAAAMKYLTEIRWSRCMNDE
jgi:hypothetical protein